MPALALPLHCLSYLHLSPTKPLFHCLSSSTSSCGLSPFAPFGASLFVPRRQPCAYFSLQLAPLPLDRLQPTQLFRRYEGAVGSWRGRGRPVGSPRAKGSPASDEGTSSRGSGKKRRSWPKCIDLPEHNSSLWAAQQAEVWIWSIDCLDST